MRDGYSGIKFLFDATEGDSRHLHVGLEIEGPFTGKSLILRFLSRLGERSLLLVV